MSFPASLRLASDHVVKLVGVLGVPRAASAAWGDEKWGEMLWGGTSVPDVPSVGVEGLMGLAFVLLLISWTLLARRRKKAKA